MARTSIATDNFNRGSLGSNWTQLNTGNAGDLQTGLSTYVHGSFTNQSPDDRATAVWAGSGSFADDQYSSIVLIAPLDNAGSSARQGVIARASTDTGSGRDYYEAYIIHDSTSTPTTVLLKYVNGTRTVLHSAAAIWAANDRLEIECEGTTIRVCRNGTALGGSFTQTDSSLTTGKPGVSATIGQYGDDWEGGSITSGDTTAPVLTSPTGTATGSTTATVGATTDEGNGTLYAFVSTSATPPSASTLKAGTGAAWAGSQAVTSTGAKTLSATGLTASTGYYAHLIHTDAAANDSNIVTSALFTTSAPADPPVITGQPSNATVKRGQTATFTVTATGSGTVTYQWQRSTNGGSSWSNVSGATSASYTTPATTISGGSANNADQFRCNVSDDDAGPVASSAATLTVQQCVLALNQEAYAFGDGNSAATMARVASTELQVAAYPLTEWPPASAVASVTATTGSNGRLADLGDDDLIFGTTYRCIARNAADGETWAWTMAAS